MLIANRMEKIVVTQLANAGVIVKYGASKLIIDGIFREPNEAFTRLSDFEFSKLLAGEPPLYDSIDRVLYTHWHPDHFDPESTITFLRNNPVRSVILPAQMLEKFPSFARDIVELPEKLCPLILSMFEKKAMSLAEDITLTAFRTIHAAPYESCDHIVYILDLGGKTLLFVSDSDYDAGYFAKLLEGVDIDVAFVNPLFLNKEEGRRVICEAICPNSLVVYHLPHDGKDVWGLRQVARADTKKYSAILPPITIFESELQELII